MIEAAQFIFPFSTRPMVSHDWGEVETFTKNLHLDCSLPWELKINDRVRVRNRSDVPTWWNGTVTAMEFGNAKVGNPFSDDWSIVRAVRVTVEIEAVEQERPPFLTTVLQHLPHFAEYVGDSRAEYDSETRIGLQTPHGEWVAYDRSEDRWYYSRFTSGCSGATLADALAEDARVGEENRLEYVASISGEG